MVEQFSLTTRIYFGQESPLVFFLLKGPMLLLSSASVRMLVPKYSPDPAAMLRLAYHLRNPDGLICLITPNDLNPFRRILREHLGFASRWVAPPHHLNYFTFDSVAKLTRYCDVEVLHWEATFPIDLFLLMGQSYIGNDAVGRHCHGLRGNLDLDLARIRRRLYTGLADHAIGREIVLFGRKPMKKDMAPAPFSSNEDGEDST